MSISYLKVGLMVAGAFVLFSVGFLLAQPSSRTADDQFTVTTTIFPLAEIARAVGGDTVAVVTLVPPGVEAHDYTPGVRELVSAAQSEVFLTVGAGFDGWADETALAVTQGGGFSVVASAQVDLLASEELDHHDDEGADEHHHEGGQDPHFWLDPVRMMVLVPKIEQIFIVADPENAALYRANSEAYMAELLALHTAYETQLATCENGEIVVTHDAYSYLASRYAFSTHASLGLSPEDEPSVGELADLTQFIREEGVTTLFFEEAAGQSLAQTLVNEVGVTPAVLSPLENVTTEQSTAGATYTSVMRNNLEALTQALVCQ
jgi:zinc transport system substrate-binding protein